MNCPQLVCPTCNIPIDSHPASRCLDVWVAKEVMGQELPIGKMASYYSTSIYCAWQVLEEMWREDKEISKKRWWTEVARMDSTDQFVDMWVAYLLPEDLDEEAFQGRADTAPLAICIAALKASASQQVECVT